MNSIALPSDQRPFDEVFAHATQIARVVAFHPASRQTPRLIHALTTSRRWHTLYYSMTADDLDVPSFMFSLIHTFADTQPGFVQQLSDTLRTANTVDGYANGLIAALTHVNERAVLLILDECDLAEMDQTLRAVLEQVAESLPSHCTMLFNGRALPRLPWLAWLAEQRAVILRDSEPIAHDFYGLAEGDRSDEAAGETGQVAVRGLGTGTIAIDGEPVTRWEGHLPRLILFFVLDRPAVTRAEICQTFWAELNDEQAANVFYVTKRRLNKALGALDQEVLISRGHTYRVNPALIIQYDVQQFVEALVKARLTPAGTQAATWQQAIALYQQPFLSDYTDRWIVDRRRAYQLGYLEALTALAAIRLAEARPEQALVLLQRAVVDAPARQDVQRSLMEIYIMLDRRSDAARQYRRLRRSLAVTGEVPEAETERLYADLVAAS